MMKLQHVLGLPVIDSNTGRSAGSVLDIWLDEHWTLKGVLLKARRWWFKHYYIGVRWEHVTACGDDALLIGSKDEVVTLTAADVLRTYQTGLIRLREMPVITENGRQLGRITDVYFQEKKGTPIVGFELTDGFVSDLMEGRKWLKAPADLDECKLGEDAIVVPARCEQDLEKIVTESG